MTHSWLNQYLLFDFIKTLLIIAEIKIGYKADVGHSLGIHCCLFFRALKKLLCRIYGHF